MVEPHDVSLPYEPSELSVRLVPPTDSTLLELAGHSMPEKLPLSPAAATNVTPTCPLGVVKYGS